MSTTLSICAKNIDGSLERIIRCTRHRGFSIDALNLKLSQCSKFNLIIMTVSSDRAISLLTKQLDKLFDVHSLSSEHSDFGEMGYAKTA